MKGRVRKAKNASATQLMDGLPKRTLEADDKIYSLQAAVTSDLDESARELVWNIFAENMHSLYLGSSMGWDPSAKKQELFHAESRFLLVHPSSESPDASLNPLVAFTMFRFEMESGQRVLYCYELQVSKECRRAGLGKFLIQCLWDIASRWSMLKVMLTVLKKNEAAASFYKTVGFAVDPISPGYEPEDGEWEDEDEDADYWIMSREVDVARGSV